MHLASYVYSVCLLDCNIPVDYLVVHAAPDLQTVATAWGDVPNHVNFVTHLLSIEQLLYEPLELVGRVCTVDEKPAAERERKRERESEQRTAA